MTDYKKESYRAWNRERMRNIYRPKKRLEQLTKENRCPKCEFFLESDYHQKFPCKKDSARKN